MESGHDGTHGARYGHFSLNELRGAVESISGAEIAGGVPGIFPGIGIVVIWEGTR
jgi:hypothetical protein